MITYRTAFVTDLGKVLVDYDWGILFQRISRIIGRSTAELESKFLGQEQQKLAEKFCRGKIDADQFHAEFCKCMDINLLELPPAKFVTFFNDVFTGEIPGVIELLPKIKKRFDLMIMITNTNELHFDFVKNMLCPRVFEFFDLVIASHEVGLHKPDGEIYNLAVRYMESLDTQRENSVFVDDLTRNLDGAKAVGIGHTFLFYPGREKEFRQYLRDIWQVDC